MLNLNVVNIKMIIFDLDGVATDGKKYTDGKCNEYKTVSMKDLDAIHQLKDMGFILGCITGECNEFSKQFLKMPVLDFVRLGCKQKLAALEEAKETYRIVSAEVCYIGDGKYDIPVLEKVGLAVCPGDAVDEVKKVSDVVLKRKGGEGCIAEIHTLFYNAQGQRMFINKKENNMPLILRERFAEHQGVIKAIMEDAAYIGSVGEAAGLIVESYKHSGRLFLCGNGGSAADAQHLAAELVGRFYLERKALSAEALTVNTSILTSLANDYDYNMIFARQLEAKAVGGDVLVGITTSGTSENVFQAFQKAKDMKMKTVLMTGAVSDYLPILKYTDCLLAAPSCNTPRIQEAHILTGHIICELVEQEMAKE